MQSCFDVLYIQWTYGIAKATNSNKPTLRTNCCRLTRFIFGNLIFTSVKSSLSLLHADFNCKTGIEKLITSKCFCPDTFCLNSVDWFLGVGLQWSSGVKYLLDCLAALSFLRNSLRIFFKLRLLNGLSDLEETISDAGDSSKRLSSKFPLIVVKH